MPPRPPPTPHRPPDPIAQKVAVHFAKTGPARWHSHHDLLRFWERAVRRAGLRVRATEGFNPRPRLVFPHPLGVGIASADETVEIELAVPLSPPDLQRRLDAAARPTLAVTRVEELPPVRKGRVVAACVYRIGGIPASSATLARIVAEANALPELAVERGPERERTRVDVRPYLARAENAGEGAVRVTLRHTERGAGRLDEWAKWFAEKTGGDWLAFSLAKETTIWRDE